MHFDITSISIQAQDEVDGRDFLMRGKGNQVGGYVIANLDTAVELLNFFRNLPRIP